jgi:hypothetical protein
MQGLLMPTVVESFNGGVSLVPSALVTVTVSLEIYIYDVGLVETR